jgi:hypothetical protein
MTLSEVVTGELAGKFGEISLFDQHADFELGSASNSNLTSLWAIVCEPTTQPSHVVSPPFERSTHGLLNLSRARTEAPPTRPGRQGARTRVQLGLRHRPQPRLGLQPPLRLLLGLYVRVQLRVGP